MIDDAGFLARIQFAFTVAFHINFPSFTVGLFAWIAPLEAMWLTTRRRSLKSCRTAPWTPNAIRPIIRTPNDWLKGS
jgi:cytochrome bd-type quinol oxidase subunit 1